MGMGRGKTGPRSDERLERLIEADAEKLRARESLEKDRARQRASKVDLLKPDLADSRLRVGRWPDLGYGGREIERGEIFRLQGMVNDAKLDRLGYVERVSSDAEIAQCGPCGKWFVSEFYRSAHGRRQHPARGRELTPEEQDREQERLIDRAEAETPLYLDKTAASAR